MAADRGTAGRRRAAPAPALAARLGVHAALPRGGGTGGPYSAETGLSPWVYVLDGSVAGGGVSLNGGDAVAWSDGEDAPRPRVGSDTVFVGFLVDMAAPSSRAGMISGR